MRLLPLLCSCVAAMAGEPVAITVDAARALGALPPLTASTGFTPASLTLTPPMRFALAIADGMPARSIDWQRPHFLLDLIAVTDAHGASPVYDFTRFDAAVDAFTGNGRGLVFEVMGNPSQAWNFDDPAHAASWTRLVTAVLRHLAERYGEARASSWWYETWNEPSKFWRSSPEGFLRYVDATAAGVRAALPQARFGGPGECDAADGPWFTRFFAHVATTQLRLDFVSTHRKALPAAMLALERADRAAIARLAPHLAGLAYLNTEADPRAGWKDPGWFHAHGWHAGFVLHSLHLHADEMRRNPAAAVLVSNDHGFLGGPLLRTLLATLGAAPTAQLKKPAHHAMVMASALVGERIHADALPAPWAERTGVLAVRRADGGIAIGVYDAPAIAMPFRGQPGKLPTTLPPAPPALVLHVAGAPAKARVVRCGIDAGRNDPMHRWRQAGQPERVDAATLAAWRTEQELAPQVVGDDPARITVAITTGSAQVFLIVPDPGAAPPPPAQVRVVSLPGVDEARLLAWTATPLGQALRYEVRCDETDVPTHGLVEGAFLIDNRPGTWSVRAVDAWERSSAWVPVR